MDENATRQVFVLMSSTVTGAEAHVEAVFADKDAAVRRKRELIANNKTLGISEYFTIEKHPLFSE